MSTNFDKWKEGTKVDEVATGATLSASRVNEGLQAALAIVKDLGMADTMDNVLSIYDRLCDRAFASVPEDARF